MTITVKNFIADLARATKDPTMVVNSATDWLEIINSNGAEMAPEVLFEHQLSVDYSTLNSTVNEIDLSDEDTYEGLYRVKSVFLEDANGKQYEYTNWTFDKNTKILYLMPTDNDVYVDDVTYAVRPSGTYPTIIVNWLGELPDTAGDGSITMSKPRLTLFRKVCVREGIRRILMDHTKLDRYRTLVGRANEYALLAIIRDMTAEIELDKTKLVNSNTVTVF
jgi:hypothetical protein